MKDVNFEEDNMIMAWMKAYIPEIHFLALHILKALIVNYQVRELITNDVLKYVSPFC